MRKSFPVEDLARDDRFVRVPMTERFNDPRTAQVASSSSAKRNGPGRLTPDRPDAPDAARGLMHGIFVGEIQALEGAGRTCWDFEVGSGNGEGIPEVPFELKLDMARQCWDEARHCEISIKLSGHMGTELGEFSESPFLYEAACNPDPVLRLTGVNRALEGLAIDVFKTMRDFGQTLTDPILAFAEDWMLADEVTHVKMGSDWLRRLTVNDKERQERALEFQRVVDKLFSLGGFRGEEDDSPVRLARRFRELAGFDEAEMDDLAEISREAKDEADRMRESLQAKAAG
jgi:uncharacterized ferritin-like protein (DUF455 family)